MSNDNPRPTETPTGTSAGQAAVSADLLPVDGQDADGAVSITVTEETSTVLRLHPELFPEGYDFANDPDSLLDRAVAEAASYGMGEIEVGDRQVHGIG